MLHECPADGLEDLLRLELEKGNCLILLDGLDEVVNSDDRRSMVQRIEDFVRRYAEKANYFVVTSRVAGYTSAPLGEPFARYAILDMDDTQIQNFLENWCQAVEDAETPGLALQQRKRVAQREINGIMKAVKHSPGVRRLAANPLLLRTLALIHRTGAQLPQKRIELYKLAADTLARTWRSAQGVPESALIKDEYLTRMLSKLAYWFHLNKATGVAIEREVNDVLGEEWARIKEVKWDVDDPNPRIIEEIKTFLEAVREHTGLFVERAPRQYGFMHLTFEEYYTARYLVEKSRTRAQLIRRHLHDPRWEEPILLALGFVGLNSAGEAAELLETAILAQNEEAEELGIRPSQYEELLGRDYLFVLRCLGDSIPVRPKLLTQLIHRLTDELLYHTGLAQFLHYRQALEEKLDHLIGSEGAFLLISHLVTALQDKAPSVRFVAVKSLARLDPASLDVVVALLEMLRDKELGVRYQTARSLKQLRQRSEEVVESLINIVHSNDSTEMREAAIESLGRLGQASPQVIQTLLDALRDSSPRIRYQAAENLERLGQASTKVMDVLLEALRDEKALVRRQAVESFGRLGQGMPEVAQALLKMLYDPDPKVRRQVVDSLGEVGQGMPEVVFALLNELHNPDSKIRYQAARSLGEVGHSSAKKVNIALLSVLDDEEFRVCQQAVDSLMQLSQSSPEALDALISIVHHKNPFLRIAAVMNLGRLSFADVEYRLPEKVEQTLIGALSQDSDLHVRSTAAVSLGRLSKASLLVLSALTAILHGNDDIELHSTASAALHKLGQSSAEILSVQLTALRDASGWLARNEAAFVIGNIGPSEETTIQSLIFGLLDPNSNVREGCVQVLISLRKRFPSMSGLIVKQLVEAIEDPKFEKPDSSPVKRPAYDYAYDALWLLEVGGE